MRIEFAGTASAAQKLSLRQRKFWASPSNDVARGIYGQAMREKQRLAGATDAQLFAELAADARAAWRGSGERQNYVAAGATLEMLRRQLDKLACAVRRADLR